MFYSTLHFSWCSSIWMSVSLDLSSSLAACRAEMSASGFSLFVRPFLAIESNTREALLMHSFRLHRNFPRHCEGFQFLLFLIILSEKGLGCGGETKTERMRHSSRGDIIATLCLCGLVCACLCEQCELRSGEVKDCRCRPMTRGWLVLIFKFLCKQNKELAPEDCSSHTRRN